MDASPTQERTASDTATDHGDSADDVLVVLINPASGTVKGNGGSGEEPSFRAQVQAALEARDARFEIRETTPEVGADALAREAASQGARRLLVCGGDGTVMAAVNGLHAGEDEAGEPGNSEPRARPVLSIVPGGTANLLATALGIPVEIEGAVEIALGGVERDIDLGRCGPHVFALGLGLGLTEKLISQTSAREKETLGKLAYAKAMLSELGASPTRFRYQLDSGPEQASSGVAIVIANAGKIGGALQFAPQALMDDGRLDLCILHRFAIGDALRMLGAMLLGRLPEDRAVTFLQGQHIKILSEPPLDLQIDGEEVEESTPLEARVLPGALRVRVSARSSQKMEEEAAQQQRAAPSRRPQVLAGALALAAGAILWRAWRRRQSA